MNITNGVVSVEDGTKKSEEFSPPRKVRVEFTFAVPEGGDGAAVAKEAGDAASAEVARLLGLKPAAAKKADKTPPVAPAAPAKPVLSDKNKLAAEAGLPVDDGLGGANEPVKPAPALVEDNLDDLLGPEAPKPITDAELTDAAQKKNKAQKDKDPKWSPVKIRELCVKYAGADKHFRDIPADKRAAFLKELDALK